MQNRTAPFQNYLENRKKLPDESFIMQGNMRIYATDEAGYIVDQRLLNEYRMSHVTSAKYGCGWVACYNALRLLGNPQPAAKVIRQLENFFVLGGYMGTHAGGIASFFHQYGYRVKLSFSAVGLHSIYPPAKANVVFYIRGPKRGAHFVAFSPAGKTNSREPLYRFYNSCTVPVSTRKPPSNVQAPCGCAGGSEGDVRTLPDMLKVEKPIFFVVLSIY